MNPPPVDTPSEPTAQLIATALAFKQEMADCYDELAIQLADCNNQAAANHFHQLAEQQRQHLQRLQPLDSGQPPTRCNNPSAETPSDWINSQAHYLMSPYHVLELALNTERHTHQQLLQRHALSERSVAEQAAGQRYLSEQQRYWQQLEQQLSQLPPPASNWHEDPDPANLDE